MANAPKPVPPGYRTVTHVMVVDDAAKALDFYAKALGAKERMRTPGPGGRIWHAEVEVGDSVVMLSDEFPGSEIRSPKSLGGSSAAIWLYVADVDTAFERAVKAGGRIVQRPETMFWGDRFGTIADPFGHTWSIATHVEDVAPAEIDRRRAAAMAAEGRRSANRP